MILQPLLFLHMYSKIFRMIFLNSGVRVVKAGGIICGDDYNTEYNHKCVIIAVQMFLKKYQNRVELQYIKKSQYVIRKVR